MISTLSIPKHKYTSQTKLHCLYGWFNPKPFSKRHNLDSAKLKEFADDNFRFAENNRKFFKSVENTVGKGEIARYEQFLLFPQCF